MKKLYDAIDGTGGSSMAGPAVVGDDAGPFVKYLSSDINGIHASHYVRVALWRMRWSPWNDASRMISFLVFV